MLRRMHVRRVRVRRVPLGGKWIEKETLWSADI